jgi:membrane-associated protease RseP (regulator of RpoE activity)
MIQWAVWFSVLLLGGIGTFENRVLSQAPLPAPGDDVAEYDLELPPPPQTLVDPQPSQPSREYSQPYLGVTFDPQFRNAAVARSVAAGSPADQAGLRAGDTIVTLNGRPIRSYDEVLQIVGRLRPGDVLDFDVTRRVSVSARAVLDGQPVDGRRTAGYRMEAESLPAPTEYRVPPGPAGQQYNANTSRPRTNYIAPDTRRSNVNRNERESDRERGFRGRASRRRG